MYWVRKIVNMAKAMLMININFCDEEKTKYGRAMTNGANRYTGISSPINREINK